MQLFPDHNYWISWLISMGVLVLRYMSMAGFSFLIFYKLYSVKFHHRKIQKTTTDQKRVQIEIISSFTTFIIFAACMTIIVLLNQSGMTKIYTPIADRGWLYFVTSIFILLIIHDTYFYWIHRLMHTKWLYKQVHAHHHQSQSPTPWAAFSFHPAEAILEFVFIIPVVVIIPFHPLALMVFAFFMTAFNVLGHLGYELFPKQFIRSVPGKLFNSTTHHDMHHHYNKSNYGLYFNTWDRLMQSNHKNYEAEFERNTGRKKTKQHLSGMVHN